MWGWLISPPCSVHTIIPLKSRNLDAAPKISLVLPWSKLHPFQHISNSWSKIRSAGYVTMVIYPVNLSILLWGHLSDWLIDHLRIATGRMMPGFSNWRELCESVCPHIIVVIIISWWHSPLSLPRANDGLLRLTSIIHSETCSPPLASGTGTQSRSQTCTSSSFIASCL